MSFIVDAAVVVAVLATTLKRTLFALTARTFISVGMCVSGMYNNYNNCWLDAGNDVGDDQGSLYGCCCHLYYQHICQRKHMYIHTYLHESAYLHVYRCVCVGMHVV